MKTKKITAVILAVVMLLSAMTATSFTANAAKKKFCDDAGYNISAYINGKFALADHANYDIRYTYTGSAITPSVVVKWRDSKTLKEGKDYTLKYEYNVNPGYANITIKGKGDYSGYAYSGFYITPKHPVVVSYSVSNTSISLTLKNSKGARGAYGAVYDTNNNRVSKAQVEKNGSSKYTLKISKLKDGKKYTLKLKSLYLGYSGADIAPDAQSIVFYT